jgi:aspartate aminotransferase
MRISQRSRRLAESATLAAAAKAKALAAAGKPVLAFAAGEPDFDTPPAIREAAIAGLAQGLTRYAPTAGTPEAREAIAAKLARENGLPCRADGVTIAVGAKHAFYLAMHCLVEPGDEVILPTPAWVSYAPIIELAGGRVVEVASTAAAGWRLSVEAIEAAITPRTRVIVLNSPSNPTGAVETPPRLRELAAMLESHPEIVVVSDEIYEKLVYPEVDPRSAFLSIGSVPSMQERTITVNGLSKAFAMTGWRVGYAAGCGRGEEAVREMAKLQGQMTSGIPTFIMPAIVAALERCGDEVEAMRRRFAARARLVAARLGAIPGFELSPPSGAFYAFPSIEGCLGRRSPQGRPLDTAAAFAEALLEERFVAVVPGGEFGRGGERSIRLSFACSEERIEEGIARIAAFVAESR